PHPRRSTLFPYTTLFRSTTLINKGNITLQHICAIMVQFLAIYWVLNTEQNSTIAISIDDLQIGFDNIVMPSAITVCHFSISTRSRTQCSFLLYDLIIACIMEANMMKIKFPTYRFHFDCMLSSWQCNPVFYKADPIIPVARLRN